jgi:hypothetical protein
MVELSSDTKQAFGRMLVFLKTAQTADHTIYPFLTYANTLIVWTEAGLKTIKKYEQYKEELEEAKTWYRAAVAKLAVQDWTQGGWQKAEIVRLTFEIDSKIFPIAMKEGILVLNQEMINVTAMLTGQPDIGMGT